MKIRPRILHSFAFLGFGLFIYITYGEDNLLINIALRNCGFGPPLDFIQGIAPASFARIRTWLPDFIWVYVTTTLVKSAWPKRHSEGLIWATVPLVLSITAEIGQSVRIVPGTFDWMDVMFYCLGFALGMFDRNFVGFGYTETLSRNVQHVEQSSVRRHPRI
jgi:hypothetical protein